MKTIPLHLLPGDIRKLIDITFRTPLNQRQTTRILKSLGTMLVILKQEKALEIIARD